MNRWVRREMREQLRGNAAARRSRYGPFHRALLGFFSVGTFGRFVWVYIAINLAFIAAEAAAAQLVPAWLPTRT
jgi:hypothetical protein